MILEYRNNIIIIPQVSFVEVDTSKNKVYIKHPQDKQVIEFSSFNEMDAFLNKLKQSINDYYLN